MLRQTEIRPLDTNIINISKAEYKKLNQSLRDFDRLKVALIAGGATHETIQILIESTQFSSEENGRRHEPRPETLGSRPNYLFVTRGPRQTRLPVIPSPPEGNLPITPTSSTHVDSVYDPVDIDEADEDGDQASGNRSLLLEGLPTSTSLADITGVIRGGAILNVYLIPSKVGKAHVSFVDPNAAEGLITHARNNGIYIKEKRIEVSWNDRQAYIPQFIQTSMTFCKATRNLVIRFLPHNMTAESIRDDLNHIHLLEVVSLTFDKGHAWISLNSIRHAITARSCLTSRYQYKSSRIEFFPDECDQPSPSGATAHSVAGPSQTSTRETAHARTQQTDFSHTNRFGALFSDGSMDMDDESVESEPSPPKRRRMNNGFGFL